MGTLAISIAALVRELITRDEGQDLVEYGLIMAMITFGCVGGMGFLANGINVEFSSVGTILTANV
jgi:Flp pilus assembly pilin Flp